jgi:hypothetical protein
MQELDYSSDTAAVSCFKHDNLVLQDLEIDWDFQAFFNHKLVSVDGHNIIHNPGEFGRIGGFVSACSCKVLKHPSFQVIGNSADYHDILSLISIRCNND